MARKSPKWSDLRPVLVQVKQAVDQLPPGERAGMDAAVASVRENLRARELDVRNEHECYAFVMGMFTAVQAAKTQTEQGVLGIASYLALEWMPADERRRIEEFLSG